MALIDCQGLTLAYGGRPVLDGVDLRVERGERVGLVGRNGEGKSTLMRIIAGAVEPDQGTVVRESGLRVAMLEQAVPDDLAGSVSQVVAAALGAESRGLGWESGGLGSESAGRHQIQRVTSLLGIDGSASFQALSGGQKRRALLARALAVEPDLLLLDEPTNHLDLGSIEWLEGFLARRTEALMLVSHDRAFLERLSTRIVELDRGRLTSWDCDYATYVERKEAWLDAEARRDQEFDRKLAREEAWVRRGLKARRTRNEGRVRALQALRRERAARRERAGGVRLEIEDAGRTGREVIRVRDLSFSWGDTPIVRDLSTTIMRGDKVGLIGPNGSGKTTLLSLLLGRLQPDRGTVRHGTALEVAYFDQHREQLDESRSVRDNLGTADTFRIGGKQRHVYGYLEDFLFSPDRAKQPVSALSGGERNRLLLARLFTRPANVLVLDEPTNDLDAETLELLEAQLVAFEGTVLVVSHDRRFLDNLCTSTLVFEGEGVVREHAGGYSDWRRVADRASQARDRPEPRAGAVPDRPRTREARLSFNERKELEALPGRIEALESELEALHEGMAQPDFFREDPGEITRIRDRVEALPIEIDALMDRWAELDERA